MRPDRVEVMSPAFDDDLSFPQRVEDFAIEQFIAQACVEALDVAILPGATWCDVGGVCANRGDPLLHGLGHELWSVVGPDVARLPRYAGGWASRSIAGSSSMAAYCRHANSG